MRFSGHVRRSAFWTSGATVALIVLAAIALAPAHSAPAASTPTVRAATTAPTVQWAYGGTANGSFSCSNTACAGLNISIPNSTFSIAWKYFVEWVVIYTQTNVSANQTEISTQAAINISAQYSYSVCTNVSSVLPCSPMSMSLSLAGNGVSTGSANLTNGTVDVLSGPGPSGSVAAVALSNASSAQELNISGSFSVSTANVSGTGSFDLGGHAHTSIAFASPLGIVPTAPLVGDSWVASAPYTASGTLVHGYDYSVSATGHAPVSISNWTSFSIAPSGTLTVTGQDVGPATLWDNYTSPHDSFDTHHVALQFPSEEIRGTDGWIFGPSLTGGLSTLLSGNGSSANNSTEDLYYLPGTGFLAANLSGNTSNSSMAPGTPSITVSAGPEPVGVAQQQFAAVSGSGGSSGGLPFVAILAVVVVAVGAVGAVLYLRHRAAGKRPPTASPAPTDPAPASATSTSATTPSPEQPASGAPSGGPAP